MSKKINEMMRLSMATHKCKSCCHMFRTERAVNPVCLACGSKYIAMLTDLEREDAVRKVEAATQ